MLSKNTFNLFYLTYYLYTYIFKNLFNFIFNPISLKLEIIKGWKVFKKKFKLFINLNNYIFFSKNWCIFFFNFMVIKKSLILKKKKKSNKIIRKQGLIKLNFFTFIL